MKISESMLAGLDCDMKAKLYRVGEDGILRVIGDSEWLLVLEELGARPGELLKVHLSRSGKASPQETVAEVARRGFYGKD